MNRTSNYLNGKSLDFFLLGGGSLVALLAIRLLSEVLTLDVAWSFSTTIMLANLINHPHFACSYQIFYGNFRQKLFSRKYSPSLRIRYFLFGVLAPLILMGSMGWMVVYDQVIFLGLAANLMFLLVGWHYVKQGYGMAMLDAALKRMFFNEKQKKLLLHNAYAVWLFSWVLINFLAKNENPMYFGIPYVAIPIPLWVLVVFAGLAGFTSIQCAVMIFGELRCRRHVALNGIIAYSVSIYAWLLIRDPILVLWIPLFHSLQYLAVVWRFQLNKGRKNISNSVNYKYVILMFFSLSITIGYYMFVWMPDWLDKNVPYNKEVFGGSLFFFLSWIFINVHHYLLDSVMWRKENHDVKDYLFA